MLRDAVKILNALDLSFQRAGFSRRQRKAFWYDFIHNDSERSKIINNIGAYFK